MIVGFPAKPTTTSRRRWSYGRSRDVFANAFTFIYSIRRGTPAARWAQVPGEVASARFKRLLDAQNAATRAYHDRKIGTTCAR